MSEISDSAISVVNVHKTFKIPKERSNGIKQQLINYLKGRKGYREFEALRGLSFDIEKGEFFGVVGRNGSGKSTLLKILAEIYTPTKGKITVNGSLIPFIELGVGFNPELSGRENVYLNGALLGFSRSEIDEMYDDIVSFAELKDFMEERLKNYSSGMQVRLAFSIAIRAQGDILLLDEVLAVGDEAFQKKCTDYFYSQKGKRTIVLVTHNMENVRKHCSRAMLINNGKVERIGDPEAVADAYSALFEE
jgi:ABC-2 type transport system ATP-binding protein